MIEQMTERTLRVAPYYRVSTEEQRKHGYSLADQRRELRSEAAKRGWQIVEEIADEGRSGADPYRPGLARIMELARAGGIDFAVAINRKRWFRDIYARRGFERELRRYGVEIRALNDTGNHIADGVDDLLGEEQRWEIARETKRGRMQRARSGKVVAGVPPYGFAFNEDKTNFVVNAETMPTVRRIFAMAATGASLNGIKNALQEDGVPTPGGRGKHWSRATLRQMLLDDAYYPHDREELERLVEEGILDLACSPPSGRGRTAYGGSAASTSRVITTTIGRGSGACPGRTRGRSGSRCRYQMPGFRRVGSGKPGNV